MSIFSFMQRYKFKEKKNTVCFTCRHVLDENRDVLFVSHDSDDGAWQFLCGEKNHLDESPKIIGLGEIVKLHPELNYLYEMPFGVYGERNDSSSQWKFFKRE